MIKYVERYKKLLILGLIAVVSVSGMALVTYTETAKGYLERLHVSNSLDMMILNTLTTGFENSLRAVDVNENAFSSLMEVRKVYEINNNSVHHGMIYSGILKPEFNDRETLRKMLGILAGDYARIRRGTVTDKISGDLRAIEETGHVYDAMNNYSYINKIVVSDQRIWLFILTFDDNLSKEKVDHLLEALWTQENKGVTTG